MTIDQGARIIVERWCQARQDDVIHFVTDETKVREVTALSNAAENCGAVPKVTMLPKGAIQSGDQIEEMRQIMSYANIIVGCPTFSFITTDAVSYAVHHGARFLSLPLATNHGGSLLEEEFINMDPQVAARMGKPLQKVLTREDTILVTAPSGTELRFSIKGRRAGLFNGMATRLGTWASASFEVYISPIETESEGVLILDGSMGYIGLTDHPLEIRLEKGYIKDIGPGPDGDRLRAYLESFHDAEMYCAAEFGIGLNQISRCRGTSYIEDESTYGTFHIGFGRNLALGGDHDALGHFDLVTHRPTITAGGTVIMRDGIATA